MRLRKATPPDARSVAALIGAHAARDLVLPRSEASILARVGDFTVADDEGVLVGCAALAELGPGLGEVRSLAVRADRSGRGIGGSLVIRLVAEAGERGFREVLVLTRRVSLFERLGFRVTDRDRFLDKLEADCRSCPHHDACDETALVRPPGRVAAEAVPPAALGQCETPGEGAAC